MTRKSLALIAGVAVLWPASVHARQPSSPPRAQRDELPRPSVVDLSHLRFDFSRFHDTTPQPFDVSMKAARSDGSTGLSSSLVMTTEVEDDAIVFNDRWTVMGREYDLTLRCAKHSLMPLLEGTIAMRRGERTRTARFTARDGVLKLEGGTETGRSLEFPPGTVLQTAIFRMVTQLPRTPGLSYTFPFCTEAIEINVVKPGDDGHFSLTCVGPASVSTDEGTFSCTRYTLNVPEPVDLYVNGNSELCRVTTADGQMVMNRREGVMAASETGDDRPE